MFQDTITIYPLMSFGAEFGESIEDLLSFENSEEKGFPSDLERFGKKESFENIFFPPYFSGQNDEESSQNVINEEEIKKNRGRPRSKNLGKASHGNKDFDNIHRKIQVHFLTFLINFCNDALSTEFGNTLPTFKQINKKSKITVKYEHSKGLKNSTIKDILDLEISTK